MRILWYSNAPWAHTGYGNQTNLFWWRIQKMGYPVTIGANYGLGGAPLNINNNGEATRVLPLGFTSHGNDIIGPYANYTKADIVITLYDAWVYDPSVTARFRWCPWMPVDHSPLPRAVDRAIKTAWQPIAYSRFGERMLKDAGFDPRYVPHGVDTEIFQPLDRQEARKALAMPILDDCDFLAIMVAANKGTPSRKAFGEVFQAWGEFIKTHPKAVLFMHTHPGPEMGGPNLPEILELLQIPK